MVVLDADGHILEPEAMFAHLEDEFYPRRPVPLAVPPGTQAGDGMLLWLIEGQVFPTTAGRGATAFNLPGSSASLSKRSSVANQTLEDVDARLKGIEEMGIDKQAIYPTMFLISGVEDVRLEAAFCRAYNNYLSDAGRRSRGRILWNALIPWRDPHAAVQELRRASDLGASGVFTMGVIWDQHLSDPAFYPIYEAASELDLPVCVHLGWGAPQVTQLFAQHAFFCAATVPVIWGFVHVMASGLLGRFPNLRIGFIETGAQWVPYAINQVRRQYEPPVAIERKPVGGAPTRSTGVGGVNRQYYRDPIDWFKEGRVFVCFEEDEDLPHLLQHLGEDALMMSTDYPHGDASADYRFVTKLRESGEVSDRVKAKLLGENADRFYRPPA